MRQDGDSLDAGHSQEGEGEDVNDGNLWLLGGELHASLRQGMRNWVKSDYISEEKETLDDVWVMLRKLLGPRNMGWI